MGTLWRSCAEAARFAGGWSELSAGSVADKYYKGLSEDAELRIDYDYEKYKDDFNKEMEKLQKRNN